MQGNGNIHPILALMALASAMQAQGADVHIGFLDGTSEQYDPRVVQAWRDCPQEELELVSKWRTLHSPTSDGECLLERSTYNGAPCINLCLDTLDERLPPTNMVLLYSDTVKRDVDFFSFNAQHVTTAIEHYMATLDSQGLANLAHPGR